MGVTLPDYVKRKHRVRALIWTGALLLTILLLFLLRTPVPETVGSYGEIERVYRGFDKAVILSGATTTSVRLDRGAGNAAVYGYSYSAKRDREEKLTLGFLGGRSFLVEETVPVFSWEVRDDTERVYIIKDAAGPRDSIREIIEEWEDSIRRNAVTAHQYEKKIELLSAVEPLMLQEYSESELLPFIKVVLWLFLMTAAVFLGVQLVPLLFPARSQTGACFRRFGLGDTDTLQLDADNITESGLYAQKDAFISPRYVSVPHYSYVFIAPVRHLLWAYPAQVIVSGRHGARIYWYLECWFTDGGRQRFRVEDKAGAAALSGKVHERFPGVLAGFSLAVYREYDGKPEKLHDFPDRVRELQEGIFPASQADVRKGMWGLDEEYQ